MDIKLLPANSPKILPEPNLPSPRFQTSQAAVAGEVSAYDRMKTPTSQEVIKLRISNTVISVIGDRTCPPFNLGPAHKLFLVENETPDITLRVHYGDAPDLVLGEKVFESGGPWSLYRHGDRYRFRQINPAFTPQPYCLATFNSAFDSGQLYWQRGEYISMSQPGSGAEEPGLSNPSSESAFPPVLINLEQIILIHFLARKCLGLLIHAFGLIDKGKGLAFCGVSGAGKSTLAEIWRTAGVTRLSDERLIVRRENGRFWIYGTPWHGEVPVASPAGAPLERLYFISQASHNFVKPLSKTEVASRLFVRCYPPFYDPIGIENVLKLISEIADEIPCYELGFVPDATVVDFIRSHRETR